MVTNEDVVRAWKRGDKISIDSMSLTTDGKNLYSYNLLIGKTILGKKMAIDYTKTGGKYHSQMTSNHVGLAKRYANKIVNPPKR